MVARGPDSSLAQFFNTLGLMLSGPVAFPTSTSLSTFSTCAAVIRTDVMVWSVSRGRTGVGRFGSPTCIFSATIFARRAALSSLLVVVDPSGLVRGARWPVEVTPVVPSQVPTTSCCPHLGRSAYASSPLPSVSSPIWRQLSSSYKLPYAGRGSGVWGVACISSMLHIWLRQQHDSENQTRVDLRPW